MKRKTGWKNEPVRHALAAKGVKTGRTKLCYFTGRPMPRNKEECLELAKKADELEAKLKAEREIPEHEKTEHEVIRIPEKSKFEIKNGDYVAYNTSLGEFVGIVRDNQKNRKTRLVEAWGAAQETGSVYADELRPISKEEFIKKRAALKTKWGTDQWHDERTD